MNSVPTIEEEVTRKGLNALAMVQADKDNSRIDIETFNYVMRVLHEAFAGIVDEEFIDIMNQMTKHDCKIVEFEKLNKVFDMEVDTNQLTINVMGRLIQCNRKLDFQNRLKQITQDLVRKGFKRVK